MSYKENNFLVKNIFAYFSLELFTEMKQKDQIEFALHRGQAQLVFMTCLHWLRKEFDPQTNNSLNRDNTNHQSALDTIGATIGFIHAHFVGHFVHKTKQWYINKWASFKSTQIKFIYILYFPSCWWKNKIFLMGSLRILTNAEKSSFTRIRTHRTLLIHHPPYFRLHSCETLRNPRLDRLLSPEMDGRTGILFQFLLQGISSVFCSFWAEVCTETIRSGILQIIFWFHLIRI